MAATNQILLTVFRDRFAPFDPVQGKNLYNPPKGISYLFSTIKQVSKYVEGGVEYGSFFHHETDGDIRVQVITTQLSGAIITAINS